MSYFGTTEWYLEVAKGNIPGHSIVHKFGAGSVSTSLLPVAQSAVYQTPTTAQALEFVSTSANDTAAGTGAREITVIGLDSNWNEVSQTVTTNGTTPVSLGTNLIRLHRWYVSSSGTYATASAGSHAGTLTIRAAGAGATWSTIPITPLPLGQSQIGAYTVPIGYKGYLLGKVVVTDTSKVADVYFFKRENANDVTAPYSGTLRITEREIGVQGSFEHHFACPKTAFTGPCDIGFMAKVSAGTADVSVEFEVLLVAD